MKKKSRLLLLGIFSVILILTGIVWYQTAKPDKEEVAVEFLTRLFTSDTERFARFKNQMNHDCNPVLCTEQDRNFMDHSHTEEYLEVYEKYCTQNCLKNMGREHLFTYVDYLASLSGKTVGCIDVKLNQVKKGGEEYSFEAILKESDSDYQIKKYSVTGKITFLERV